MIFDGETLDGEPLIFAQDTPLVGIRFIRVETLTSPSWISWRKIEVIAAE
ncbi:MAG: hypothetical protein WBL25_20310 [Anaerolineales bacterium]